MPLFRRAQTPPDSHARLLEVLEEVQLLRGRMKSLEAEWDDMRGQIRKGYQRLEKAAERAERPCPDAEASPEASAVAAGHPASGFVKKLQAMRGV